MHVNEYWCTDSYLCSDVNTYIHTRVLTYILNYIHTQTCILTLTYHRLIYIHINADRYTYMAIKPCVITASCAFPRSVFYGTLALKHIKLTMCRFLFRNLLAIKYNFKM